ncbi:MAG TPA: TolC family protein, partial [Chitinophagales bacterium]|nr:TolC family protein [Chitinophagales bacterium]
MKRICIVSIILILAVQIKAQTIKKLNLQEAFELAIQHSKQLQIDSLKIQALDFKKKQAQNAMLPVVAINAGYTRLSDNIPDIIIAGGAFKIEQIVNQFNNRVTLQQPIFQGLRNWNTMKSLDQQKEAASFDKQKNLQDVKLSVVQAYFSLYKLQQAKILLDSNIAQTQTRVNDIIKFKDAGIVLNNDVMRAELQKTNLLVSKADV